MPDLLLAHDIGTTGDKATLFDASGHLIASTQSGYAAHHPAPGGAEQNPDDWWDSVCRSTRSLLDSHPDARGRIAAVSFSGMMNGCVLVDGSGRPVRSALIHADIRAGAQSRRIAENVDAGWLYQRTGHRPAPYYTLAKLSWLVENEPDSVSRTRWCIQSKDFIAGRMTGIWGVTDPSDASLTGMCDIRTDRWLPEAIAAGGIPEDILPEILPSTTVIGSVTAEAAEATGLVQGTPVVLGGGDGACATAGAGVFSVGEAYHYMGSTSWIARAADSPSGDPLRRICTLRGLAPGLFVDYGTVQSAGASIDWFLNGIGVGEAAGEPHAAMEELARRSVPGAGGLLFLPYLQGERAPIWDSEARGFFFGLSDSHSRADLARAVYEGVALALGSILDVFDELGPRPAEVRALGGGMKSGLWRDLLAAIYGRPLVLLEHLSEATSCGAAIAAAIGVGILADWKSARAFAPTASRVEPDAELSQRYRLVAPLFGSIYPALADHFGALAELRETLARLSTSQG